MTKKYYVTCTENNSTNSTLENVIKDVIKETRSTKSFVNEVLNDKKIKGLCIYDGCDCGERLVNRQRVSAGIRRYFFIADTYTVADAIVEIAEDYNMTCKINKYNQS